MIMNWDEMITVLMEKWDDLTREKKPLEIRIVAYWESGIPRNCYAYLWRKYAGEDRRYFNTVQDAQKWIAGQLTDMLEEEFRRQVALQEEEEAKEGKL